VSASAFAFSLLSSCSLSYLSYLLSYLLVSQPFSAFSTGYLLVSLSLQQSAVLSAFSKAVGGSISRHVETILINTHTLSLVKPIAICVQDT
jgi:hypothetical protein